MFASVLRRHLSKFICWCTLKTIGFFFIDVEVLSKKFRISKQTLKVPTHGDVILVNHVSWLDFVLLERLYSPVFGRLIREEATGEVAASAKSPRFVPFDNLLQAITHTVRNSSSIKAAVAEKSYSLQDLIEIARKKRLGPIVIFPEECTSNGRSILSFAPDFDFLLQGVEGLSPSAVFVACIKYSLNTQPFVCGGFLRNLYAATLNLIGYVHFRIFPMSCVLKDLEDSESYVASMANVFSGETCARCMCHVSRLRQVKLSAREKQAFVAYFNEKQAQ